MNAFLEEVKRSTSVARKVLERKGYTRIFLASSFVYAVLISVMTNQLDVRAGVQNARMAFTLKGSLLVGVLPLLAGLLVAFQVFAFKDKKKNLSSKVTGTSGVLISFFATSCPFCKPLIISLLGLSGSLAILNYGTLLGVVSGVLLLISNYLTAKNIGKGCEHCEDINKRK